VSGEFFSCAHLCIFDSLIFAPTFAYIARFRSTAEKHAKTAKKDFLTDMSLVVKKNGEAYFWGCLSAFLGEGKTLGKQPTFVGVCLHYLGACP